MPDPEDRETIRQRKAEELKRTLESDSDGDASSETGADVPSEPIYVSDATHLEQVIGRQSVVLADFYADWCGPCKMVEPVIAELASETEAAVVKVDVDAHQALAAQYGVRGVPTFVLFADGSPTERLVGVQDKSRFVQLIDQHAG